MHVLQLQLGFCFAANSVSKSRDDAVEVGEASELEVLESPQDSRSRSVMCIES